MAPLGDEAVAPAPGRGDRGPGRLAVEGLGSMATALVGLTWASGLLYVGVRLGAPAPLPLPTVDGLHAAAGVVAAVLVLGKVLCWRWGVRRRPARVTEPWPRLVSLALSVLLGAALASGALAAAPLEGSLQVDTVNLHLLASVWLLPPTGWHLWHHRRRIGRFLRRGLGSGRIGLGLGLGLALATCPGLAVALQPRVASEPSRAMAGASWSRAGPRRPLARLAVGAHGRRLVAAGQQVLMSADGERWQTIQFAADAVTATEFLPGGHGSAHGISIPIQSLVVGPAAIEVGTAEGLYAARAPSGPLIPTDLPGQDVTALAVDPTHPERWWTASTAGVLYSPDGGRSWTERAAGLAAPEQVSALVWAGGSLFASDGTAVYEWEDGPGRWRRCPGPTSILALAGGPGGPYALAGAGEVWGGAGQAWRELGRIGGAHPHGGHLGAASLVADAGRLYAAVGADVWASPDGGRTWVPMGRAGAQVEQLAVFHDQLWAATTSGLYRYPLVAGTPADPWWWGELMGEAAAGGVAATVGMLGLLRPRPAGGGADRGWRSLWS